MELSGGLIIGIFRSLIGSIYPPFRKKYFDQPKIYVVFQFNNSSKSPRGLSASNDTTAPIFVTEAIYNNDLNWQYDIIFRNNSEYPAYNLKLIEPTLNSGFNIHPPLDSLKPILPNSEVSYKAKFFQTFEGKGEVANLIAKHPPDKLKSGKFIFEYTNVKGTKFYTTYEHALDTADRHKFSRTLDKQDNKKNGN